ncbi:hypothetical protein GKZ68_01520 [Hymenobacter sp. BRD128]|uniref:hypothetical protein n=1 Tax=Hymenobacter sp. BRD128 TaxID=2675878 RepID=UPI00156799C0|nr:hypothetical protein [Hymenobacter sp. BRD128]QKG55433.1 hypothetical protein GKZ68_01520 [Hymenobacter sp. BRD128]
MNMPYGNYGGSPQNLAYRQGAGSYQLPDGTWQPAQIMTFDGNRLVVKDDPAAKRKLTASGVRQLEILRDTFLVVNKLPGKLVATNEPDFVQSLFNRQGVRLLVRYPNGYGHPSYFLSRPNVPLALLPSSKAGFKKELLTIVQGCPALVAQLENDTLGQEDLVQILQEYVECQRRAKAATK